MRTLMAPALSCGTVVCRWTAPTPQLFSSPDVPWSATAVPPTGRRFTFPGERWPRTVRWHEAARLRSVADLCEEMICKLAAVPR